MHGIYGQQKDTKTKEKNMKGDETCLNYIILIFVLKMYINFLKLIYN